MIAIINYGSGNVRAIGNIYDQLKIEYQVVNSPKEMPPQTSRIILPGVGAFDQTMSTLLQSGFKELLDELVLDKQLPALGICVGMQILSAGSEEGDLAGLNWVPGVVKKLPKELLLHKPKLPHLGWNSVKVLKETPLVNDIDVASGFYFIHSFYFECLDESDVLTTTHYGKDFASAVNKGNIYGTQFHPEKSHSNGIALLRNFANI